MPTRLIIGNSLMVEWLGPCAFTTESMCLIHDQGTKIPQSCTTQQKQNKAKTNHKRTTAKRKLGRENTGLFSVVSVNVEDRVEMAASSSTPAVLGSVVSDSWDPMDCSPPGSSVRGIFQARMLEWIDLPDVRIKPHLLRLLHCSIADEFLPTVPPGKPYSFASVCCYL